MLYAPAIIVALKVAGARSHPAAAPIASTAKLIACHHSPRSVVESWRMAAAIVLAVSRP